MQPIYARIFKVDEETRTVHGRAVQEVVDRDNELFDYVSSKPEFMKWSAEVSADTNGKSLGNVRSMHGNIAAGKLTNIDFNDAEKAIDVSAKIIDDNEWEKCLEGVHTGFSIGGRYAKKWAEPINGKMVTRYTAVPSEISIVDRPCIPTAKFLSIHKFLTINKKDGTTILKPFVTKDARDDEAHPVTGTPMNDSDVEKDGDGGGWVMPEGATTGIQAYDEEGKPAKPKKPAEKRKFSDKQRAKLADTGAAMPDGSFPIANEHDLRNAIQAHGRAKNKAKAKAHIIARAKALGATSTLPDDWKKADGLDVADFDEERLEKFFDDNSEKITETFGKGINDVAALGNLIAQLKYLAENADYERQVEGDDSKVPEALKTASATLLGVLADMAKEESTEITTGTTAEDVMADAATKVETSDIANALSDVFGLAKRGARNSKKDLELIQKVHDASCELGAGCKSAHENDGEDISNQEAMKMRKADTITAEGDKRGADVTDPTLPKESSNADDAERTADEGQEAPTSSAKKSKKRMDMEMAAKGKKRPAKDMDMDECDDEEDDEDDMDDDEDDAPPPKAKKKAKKFSSDEDMAKAIATAVATALAPLMKGNDVHVSKMPPKLLSVGKDGSVEKYVPLDAEALKKSVKPHPKDASGDLQRYGDSGTATLIKAIWADPKFRIDPREIDKLQ